MRIAVVADIHGNVRALRAVMDDLKQVTPDSVVNLGDCASGPLEAAETVDVLVRFGPLRNSPLMARRLGDSRAILCASPEYVSRWGKPRRAVDLARHACLTYLRDGRIHVFDPDGRASAPAVAAPFAANDEDVIRQMVLASYGIAWLFEFLVADDLQTGALVQLLGDRSTPKWPIHALYPKNPHLLPKARAFIDFFALSLNGQRR